MKTLLHSNLTQILSSNNESDLIDIYSILQEYLLLNSLEQEILSHILKNAVKEWQTLNQVNLEALDEEDT
jgi:hypothetical protein